MIRNWNDNDNKASQKKSLIKTLEVGFLKLLLAFPPNKQWNHTWETCVPIKYLLISWNHWLTLIIIKISFLWRKTKQNSKSLSALGWTQLKETKEAIEIVCVIWTRTWSLLFGFVFSVYKIIILMAAWKLIKDRHFGQFRWIVCVLFFYFFVKFRQDWNMNCFCFFSIVCWKCFIIGFLEILNFTLYYV